MQDETMISAPPTDNFRRSPAGRFRRFVRALVIRLLRIVVLFYVIAAGLLYFGQGIMIFQGHSTQGLASSTFRLPPQSDLIRINTPRGQVVALFAAAMSPRGRVLRDRAKRPTLLYFYGNAMCLADTLDEIEMFRRLGVNVLVPDYLGYGLSGGMPGEAACYATADAAYDYLHTRRDIDPRKIVVSGYSLGAASAIYLASRKPVAGLAVFAAFTSMSDIAHRYFQFFPVPLLLVHHFDNETRIHHVTCPILLAHGTLDNIAPFPMMDQLAHAAGGPVTALRVDGASHADLFYTGGDRVLGPLRTFLNRV